MSRLFTERNVGAWILRIVALVVLAFSVIRVLLLFVMLKEDPIFWRSEGGYPTWLTGLVLETFYPLILIQFLTLTLVCLCDFCALPFEKTFRLWGHAAFVLLWLVFGLVLTILVWNNADNILSGRDLHYHPY